MGIREIQKHIKELRKQEKEELKAVRQEINEKLVKAQANTLYEFGRNLKKARIKRDLSQDELASRAGFARTTVTNMENATQDVTLTSMVKLAIALDCKLSDLMPQLDEEAK